VNGIEWMWMWENDIDRIGYWLNAERHEIRLADAEKLEEMAFLFLDLFESRKANGYRIAMVGLLNRGASKQKFQLPLEYAPVSTGCGRCTYRTLGKIGFRFDESDPHFFMADFYCQLRLLEADYLSVRGQSFNWDQRGSNTPGVAKGDRNEAGQERSAETLGREHPLLNPVKCVRRMRKNPKQEDNFALDLSGLQRTENWRENLRRYVIDCNRASESGDAEPYSRNLDPRNPSYEKDLESVAKCLDYRLEGKRNGPRSLRNRPRARRPHRRGSCPFL
jgi:hypothetical protein